MIEWNENNIQYENSNGMDLVNDFVNAASSFCITYNKDFESEIIKICTKSPKSIPGIIKSKKFHYLWDYILQTTPLLTYVESKFDIVYNTTMRINWCLNHRQMFPQCFNEKCNTKILYKLWYIGWNEPYEKFCHNKCICINQSKYHRDHVKQTLMLHYGVDVPAKSPIVLNQMQDTTEERFGVRNIFSHPDVIKSLHTPEKEEQRRKSINKYMQEHFGVDWYFLSDEFLKKTCASNGKSKEEKYLVEFIRSNTKEEVIVGSFKVIPPCQLDIYIDSLKLAFEFNGTYYHSIEWHDDINKHLKKTVACELLGIRLVHIWEDDWILRKERVKGFILKCLAGTEISEIDFSKDVIEIDRSRFNKTYSFLGYDLIEETNPILILREKRNMTKYSVPDCGKLIYKKIQ